MKVLHNKKALERGLVFIFSMFLIALLFFIFFMVNRSDQASNEEIIAKDLKSMQYGIFLSSYLNSGSAYGIFSDLIIESYSKNDFAILESETSKYLNKIYTKEIGWEMTLNKEKIGERYKGSKKIIEDNAVVPGIDRQPIKITLKVSHT